MIDGAFKAGKRIKEKSLEKNLDIFIFAEKIKLNKNDKFNLIDTYLNILNELNITADNNFMIDLLKEETKPLEVATSLCLGIVCSEEEESEFISFVEAAERFGVERNTLQKAKSNGRFKEDEWKKVGRDLYVKVSAMERLYAK